MNLFFKTGSVSLLRVVLPGVVLPISGLWCLAVISTSASPWLQSQHLPHSSWCQVSTFSHVWWLTRCCNNRHVGFAYFIPYGANHLIFFAWFFSLDLFPWPTPDSKRRAVRHRHPLLQDCHLLLLPCHPSQVCITYTPWRRVLVILSRCIFHIQVLNFGQYISGDR